MENGKLINSKQQTTASLQNIITKFKDDFEKVSLTPVTFDYQIICDEGCKFIYEKVK